MIGLDFRRRMHLGIQYNISLNLLFKINIHILIFIIAITMYLSPIYRACFSTTQPQSLRLPSFSHFPLLPSIYKYLEQQDIHTPTFIQYSLLSKLYANQQNLTKPINSYHIVSHTGSGKTLAYMLPIIDSLKKQQQKQEAIMTKAQRPRAIIFTANKELVLQARNLGKEMSHHCKIKCQGLNIGKSLHFEKQTVKQGVDILVTNFVRFNRMLENKEVFLSNLQWAVIDEIDTMYEAQTKSLSLLFEKIILPKLNSNNPNFKLIMSSTTNPEALTSYITKKVPQKAMEKIVDKKTHLNLENIKHEFIHCDELDKHDPLLSEITRSFKNGRKTENGMEPVNKILIFCNTVKSLHQLQYFLENAAVVKNLVTLHSQLNKLTRLTNYERFRDLSDKENGIMLATDLGARGLHFPNLNYIVNYDFPLSTCDYLQRAGRTGRGGKTGYVVTLYHKKHLKVINQLKDASFNVPLKVNNSAYGFRNRQQSNKPSKFKH